MIIWSSTTNSTTSRKPTEASGTARKRLRPAHRLEVFDLERSIGELANYFDYEAFGRELFMYDYSMGANNNVFRHV